MGRPEPEMVDVLIVGGGINGVGIARDAAGRGLSVLLVEKDDLANHTSSASTKLIHGGLRYLEYGEFRLVREALIERERLLAMAPHIIRPLEFVLPLTRSPRPAWMVRLGLFLYDHLGGRRKLPGTRSVALGTSPLGDGLSSRGGKAFTYWDCWVDDSRLVVLNARDAAERGARIETRCRFLGAVRSGNRWTATISDAGGRNRTVHARALVNAAGPWIADVLEQIPGARSDRTVRLIKGSHIVVPRLYRGDHALLLQNPDRRIVFAIPYEGAFTLIGTTDEAWQSAPGKVSISPAETRYLLDTIGRYFTRPLGEEDIVWSYAGIRPLYDDRAANASAVTRDYILDLDAGGARAPLLSIFGGKITTYRKLAEHALRALAPFFPSAGPGWTAAAPLPGGDIANGDFDAFLSKVIVEYPALSPALLNRLARAYGTRARAVLHGVRTIDELGPDFGGRLTRAEVDYLVAQEWARTADDILFRRSKLGLHVPPGTAERLEAYLAERRMVRAA